MSSYFTKQPDLLEAAAAGEQAMNACFKKAQGLTPEFKSIAEKAILAHLQVVGQASGEVLTDVAKAKGARPHDDRSFGAIYQSMARRGLIRAVGYCKRTKGHGTGGGNVWGLAC